MFGIGPATRIYLAAGATDMRKGFEGLYGLVRDQLPFDGAGFQRFKNGFVPQPRCGCEQD